MRWPPGRSSKVPQLKRHTFSLGVLEGFNGTVLAYGQTASGKTYTMQGELDDPVRKGIIPRIVDAVFRKIQVANEKVEFTIKASVVEIYNERVRDLLDPSKDNLTVREDRLKGIFIDNLTEASIGSAEEVYDLMRRGNANRAVGVTNMNSQSSRSHSIFMLEITMNDLETYSCKTGKLYLVDLAGSEMVEKSGATGKTLEEAKNINRSLTMLGRVINALTDGKSEHIPYRDSKLTRILQTSLGGNSRTCLVITASPAMCNSAETLSTCRFGARARFVKNNAKINRLPTVTELECTIKRLTRELNRSNQRVSRLEALVATLGGAIPPDETGQVILEEDTVASDEPAGKLSVELLPLARTNSVPLPAETITIKVDEDAKRKERVEVTFIKMVDGPTESPRVRSRPVAKLESARPHISPKRASATEDTCTVEKSYPETEVQKMLATQSKREQTEYAAERRIIVDRVGELSRRVCDLTLENERLSDALRRLELMHSKEYVKRQMIAMQNNLTTLNQLYHQKLNQWAAARYDLETQSRQLKRMAEMKDDTAQQIAIMREQINATSFQCEQLKEIIRTSVPAGEEALASPAFSRTPPMLVGPQNVLRAIRGGYSSYYKECERKY